MTTLSLRAMIKVAMWLLTYRKLLLVRLVDNWDFSYDSRAFPTYFDIYSIYINQYINIMINIQHSCGEKMWIYGRVISILSTSSGNSMQKTVWIAANGWIGV